MPAYKLASVRAYALMHTHTHIFTLYLVRLELLQEERGRVWGHVVDSDERFYLLVFVESPEIFILCGKGGRFFLEVLEPVVSLVPGSLIHCWYSYFLRL